MLSAIAGCNPGAEQATSGGGHAASPSTSYRLLRVLEVEGRQGVATDGRHYFVSGTDALFVYSKEGELLRANRQPFAALEAPANHIGDIDVHAGEIYAGVERFADGRGTDIRIAVYDAETLEYRRSIDWAPGSGQLEVSGVAVDAAANAIWLSDWVDGNRLFRYDLDTGSYGGHLELLRAPQRQQGLAVHGHALLITSDDGDADHDRADNLWRVEPAPGATVAFVEHEHAFTDLRRAGEIEGLAVDEAAGELVVLSNRGARIVLGMPSGFYPGYDREIHELYLYAIGDR